ncbi:endopeptidase La [Dictyobacter arantiisoli]|uniref:Lon protease n=1 Tax=Dictyobacter arantiisoli TaxID=2014874 RepID=A0A5A5T756_9CHLR|nr:endopeptidase La [Dictyobacter arantiisoli]GCF07242.1 Lon protease [Dictyobacter arantiisoli]
MEKITNHQKAEPQEDVIQKERVEATNEFQQEILPVVVESELADAAQPADETHSATDVDPVSTPSSEDTSSPDTESAPQEPQDEPASSFAVSSSTSDESDSDASGTAPVTVTEDAKESSESSDTQPRAEDEEPLNIPEVLPILPLKDTVIYPFSVQPFSVGQERYIRLIDDVMRGNRLVVLVAQKSPDIDHAGPDDIYRVGTVSRVGRMFRMPDGTVQIAVQGLERVTIDEFTQEKPYLMARVTSKPDTQENDTETEAIKRNVISYFQRLVALVQNVPEGVAAATLNLEEPRQVVYVIATFVQMEMELRQKLLEIDSVHEKLNRLSDFLTHELEILELGKKIQNSAQEEMGKVQREYLLREQLKAIQRELGEESEEQATVNELRRKLEDAKMPDEAYKEANRELSRLEKLPTVSPEYSIIRTYVELLVSLPWNKGTATQIDVPHAREVLDQDHYDLQKIKERILEYLAVRRLKEDRLSEEKERARAEVEIEGGVEVENIIPTQPLINQEAGRPINREPILCFVGPPGVGKTSLGQSIARALGRKFARMSLGGIRDEAEIRGHRRTYIGAMPGRIIQTLRRLEANDPVIMLDEVDKVGADWRGDPSSALLEVLDPEQNYNFRDNYLDLPFDLSKVMFIATANSLEPIPAPLRDRMEILELSGYTEEQKLHIALNYLLPKQRESNGLKENELTIDDDAIRRVARDYTREAGVRNLERQIGSLSRKVARQISEGLQAPIHIAVDQVPEYLGRQRFFDEVAERIDRPGIATGLAWTAVGGEIMFIEVATMPGKEERLILTGQLGDVMKESAMAALSYVRSNATALGLPKNVFEGQNIHIHVPAGGIPKDGPSAGVTMTTVLVSLATGRKVRSDVAMTGEITLRGKVMPIGGIKEKTLAAYRSGIRTVILPEKNKADLLEDIPVELRDQMSFVYVSDIREVLDAALEPEDEQEHDHKGSSDGDGRSRKHKGSKNEKSEKAVAKA